MSSVSALVGPRLLTEEEKEEKLDALNSVPLFMKSLPTDDVDNTALAALQALVHEGMPDEVAQNFKEQGNEYFKGRRYREALGFYTQGIDARPTDPSLQENLLCNRAASNLELQNYGSTLRDCSKALIINPRSSKAYYRSALALLALEKPEEALDCCDRCLVFDQGNQSMHALREKVIVAKSDKDRREKERLRRLKVDEAARGKMEVAFRERNLISIPQKDGSINSYSPHFDSEDPTSSTLVIPVFFLYPQHATSDIIKEYVEDTPFGAHISAMFPPEVPPPKWDKKGEYIANNLVIYAMTHRKRLLRVGKKMTLCDVFKTAASKETQTRDGLEVKDGCLSFVVIPKGTEETKWVEEYKRRSL